MKLSTHLYLRPCLFAYSHDIGFEDNSCIFWFHDAKKYKGSKIYKGDYDDVKNDIYSLLLKYDVLSSYECDKKLQCFVNNFLDTIIELIYRNGIAIICNEDNRYVKFVGLSGNFVSLLQFKHKIVNEYRNRYSR